MFHKVCVSGYFEVVSFWSSQIMGLQFQIITNLFFCSTTVIEGYFCKGWHGWHWNRWKNAVYLVWTVSFLCISRKWETQGFVALSNVKVSQIQTPLSLITIITCQVKCNIQITPTGSMWNQRAERRLDCKHIPFSDGNKKCNCHKET